SLMGCVALAGRDAPNNLRAVSSAALGVKCSFASSDALDDQPSSFINKYRHKLFALSSRHHALCGIFHVCSNCKVQSGVLEDFAALLHVGPFQAKHHRQLDVGRLGCLNHAIGQHIDAQDAAKNVDQQRFYIFVTEQDFEGMANLLGVGSAADIEEVGRRAAGVLDDVHGGHGQACAVDHAGDVA